MLAIVNTGKRVDRTRQCVIFGIGSGHAKMCWLNTFMSVSVLMCVKGVVPSNLPRLMWIPDSTGVTLYFLPELKQSNISPDMGSRSL